ncbi:hypothetical protein AB0D67_24245 [Streptosporangium sp. NPDC048047]|uniref:hypothetical protein n=1 Tax=Streptosporangium sp. NPDC048047 TaxID=3155748 RepID=UPI0034218B03
MAGWAAFDINQHGQAQQHFGHALKLAKAGDDSLTGVQALTALARQAIHLEQPAWAVWLARAAADTARRADAPPRVMSFMLNKEAWATALRARSAGTLDVHGAREAEPTSGPQPDPDEKGRVRRPER